MKDIVRDQVDEPIVELNGKRIIKGGEQIEIGVCKCSWKGNIISFSTDRFEWAFKIAGPKLKPFINEEIRVLVSDYSSLKSHGLVGQTWMKAQETHWDRNKIWQGHEAGVDFQFMSSDFLEGHLIDYTVDSLFDDLPFKYNKYMK
jgi:hypothetical protein